MFSFEVEKEKYALKPMNCPGHWYVFVKFQQFLMLCSEVPVKAADT